MAERGDEPKTIVMPQPTAAPLVLAAGLVMLAAGVALNLSMSVVGFVLLLAGLGMWIAHLLPGRGHIHEPVAPDKRPQPVRPVEGAVERMHEGVPGYRMRLPLKLHPISAGIKGGLAGGALMPIPALAWSVLSGHGLWFPVNLLVGMVWAGVDSRPVEDLQQFHPVMFVVACIIHAVMSLVLGLMYGVLLPTLPHLPGGQLIWGGLLMPLLWTGISYGLMGVVNPLLYHVVNWPWFIVSQFVFGIAAAIVVTRSEKIAVPPRGAGPDTASLTS